MKSFSVGRLLSFLMAGLLLISTALWGGEAQAFQFDDALASAGKSFLSAVLSDYTKATDKVYDTTLKDAQNVVNELAEKLEKAADANISPADRKSLVKQINSAQKSLGDIAKSFNGFADDTKEFDGELETTVQKLLDAVQGDTRKQLGQTESAFRQISQAISGLADDANKVDANNLTDLLGDFGKNIESLKKAITLGGSAVKALSLLAG
jgi:methyl-accepting chemotaxis protein